MTITPLEPLEPYCAVAAASFSTSSDSISAGLKSANGLSWKPAFIPPVPPPPSPPPPDITGTPSITYSGSLAAEAEPCPRTRTVTPAPATPELWVICRPGARPCKAASKLGVGVFWKTSPFTVAMLAVDSTFFSLRKPVTTASFMSFTSSSSAIFITVRVPTTTSWLRNPVYLKMTTSSASVSLRE